MRSCAFCGNPLPAQAEAKAKYCGRICFHKAFAVMKSEPLDVVLWRRVRKSDACWLWVGGNNGRGYGVLSAGGKRYYAHRASWQVNYGPIPDGLDVLHACDNPPCVRPDHLFLGDAVANGRDMRAKRRDGASRYPEKYGINRRKPEDAPRGEQHPRARLNDDIIRHIRSAHAAGESQRSIGRRLGIGQSHVKQIVHRRIWAHVV